MKPTLMEGENWSLQVTVLQVHNKVHKVNLLKLKIKRCFTNVGSNISKPHGSLFSVCLDWLSWAWKCVPVILVLSWDRKFAISQMDCVFSTRPATMSQYESVTKQHTSILYWWSVWPVNYLGKMLSSTTEYGHTLWASSFYLWVNF